MAETPSKRPREEPQTLDFEDENPSTKRQKPYNTILSLLEEEEEEDEDEREPTSEPSSEDLSAMFRTLQQELSSSTSCDSTAFDEFDFTTPYTAVEVADLEAHHHENIESSTSAVCSPRSGDGDGDGDGEDEGAKSVMRHLLEASDDELGIPNREDIELKSGDNFPFALSDHGLWEIEDETANYYAVLQSELFM